MQTLLRTKTIKIPNNIDHEISLYLFNLKIIYTKKKIRIAKRSKTRLDSQISEAHQNIRS